MSIKKIASAAVEYLNSLGHRCIGYGGECHNEARYNGYLDTMKKYELDPESDYVVECKQTEAEGFEIMQRFLQSSDCPTVRLPKDEMGKFAMHLLLDRIKDGHKSVVRTELEGKLMIRNSCNSVEASTWSDYCI